MKVAILRPKEYAERTTKKFEEMGFEVVAVPFLKTVPRREGIERIRCLENYDVVVVTSQTSAKLLVEHGFRHGNVIAIGKKTAEVLRSAGVNAKIPSKFDSRTIYEEFRDELEGKSVAVVRSDKGDPILLKLPNVEEIVLYTIEFEHGEEQRRLIEEMDFDAIVFSSRMMVKSFLELAKDMGKLDEVLRRLKEKVVVAIGPPTKETLEEYGISAEMPSEYTFDGVMELLKGKVSKTH